MLGAWLQQIPCPDPDLITISHLQHFHAYECVAPSRLACAHTFQRLYFTRLAKACASRPSMVHRKARESGSACWGRVLGPVNWRSSRADSEDLTLIADIALAFHSIQRFEGAGPRRDRFKR